MLAKTLAGAFLHGYVLGLITTPVIVATVVILFCALTRLRDPKGGNQKGK